MKTDPWMLVLSGRFEEAYQVYSKRYQVDGRPSHLANRGLVLLNMGKISEAAADFATLSALRGNTEMSCQGDYDDLGVCQWLLGDHWAAIETWKMGQSATYVDAAGGVLNAGLMMYGAVRLGNSDLIDEALLRFRKLWKSPAWPGAVAGLHLGHLTPVELLHLAAKRPQLRVRYECQAHFHLGVYALWQGDQETARLFFQLSAGAKPEARVDIEHYLARGEAGVPQQSLLGSWLGGIKAMQAARQLTAAGYPGARGR